MGIEPKLTGQLRPANRTGRNIAAFQNLEADLAGSGRRDFAVMNSYALQGDAQVLLVSTNEAGLGFSD
jgi:hypothetical protein